MSARRTRGDDLPAVRRLYMQARRTFVNFGEEDLLAYVACEPPLYGWAAEEWKRVCGFVACSARRAAWPEVRGLLLAEAWPTAAVLSALFTQVTQDLRGSGAEGLMCLATADWLIPVLTRAGFQAEEQVINMRWDGMALPARAAEGVAPRLRPAQPADLAALVALDDAAFASIWRLGRDGISLYLMTTGHFVVAEQEGEIVGYAASDTRGSEAQIVRVAVHPDAQGRGIGRYLMLDALAHALREGTETAILNTQVSNVASQRLYQSLGFRTVGKTLPVLVRRL